jgi:hypothetical protein
MIFRGLLGGKPGDDLLLYANLLSRERNEEILGLGAPTRQLIMMRGWGR